MPRVLGEARWPGSEGGHLDALCLSTRSPRSRRGPCGTGWGPLGQGRLGGPDPGPLTPGTAGEAYADPPDTRAGAHQGRAVWRLGGPDPGPLTPGAAGEASADPMDTRARAHQGRAGLRMGGPDPGPLTTRSGRGGLRGPAGHPGRGPLGKGSLEDGRAQPGPLTPGAAGEAFPDIRARRPPGPGPIGEGQPGGWEGPTRGP
ncbi:hypothetical protein NDU88_006801 [Pleurodeles waltl]|uniref:Uncharacterized protein n=1 Tax=Pleurodeles waltl TaxID=8319 RepID=A0AAV7PLZ3_PLEWA|nr:hypothetical protein NDU88_006801 [Pleurodeles waltl]